MVVGKAALWAASRVAPTAALRDFYWVVSMVDRTAVVKAFLWVAD